MYRVCSGTRISSIHRSRGGGSATDDTTVSYNEELDTLYIHFEVPDGLHVACYLDDGVYALFDVTTLELVGFQVENWQREGGARNMRHDPSCPKSRYVGVEFRKTRVIPHETTRVGDPSGASAGGDEQQCDEWRNR